MFDGLKLRFRALLQREKLEQDLDDELAFHLAERAERLRADGAPDPEHAAARRFGNATRVREDLRDAWTFPRLESVWHDLRYAGRQLRRSPGFAAVAVLSLALGIGANSAIFALVDAILLKSLPVPEPEQLVILYTGAKKSPPLWRRGSSGMGGATGSLSTGSVFPYRAWQELRDGAAQSAKVFAWANLGKVQVAVRGQAMLASGQMVSGNYFSGLDVQPLIGRALMDDDDRPGATPAVVLTHLFWQKAFGADPGVIGRTIAVDGTPFTIVGVTRPGFFGLSRGGFVSAPDLIVPLSAQPLIAADWARPGHGAFDDAEFWWLNLTARLKPGASSKQVQDRWTAQWRSFLNTAGLESDPAANAVQVILQPGAQGVNTLRRRFSGTLLTLFAIAGLVLLIACANVANLLLARAAARRREMGVRLSLGAARPRLIRQLVTESLLTGGAGGALGVLLARWGIGVLAAMLFSGDVSIGATLHPDARLLAFGLGLSLLTVLLFGLAPALTATRADLRPRRWSFGNGVIVVQVALSLVLLAGAGLFLRTLQSFYSVELGFDKRNLLLFSLDPTRSGIRGEGLIAFYEQLLPRLRALPGVVSATASSETLLSGRYSGSQLTLSGDDQPIPVRINRVSARFFETLGIAVLSGRGVEDRDSESAPPVAVISQTAIKRCFPEGAPLGRRFRWAGRWRGAEITVVGIVADTRAQEFQEPIAPTVYVPYRQGPWPAGAMNFEVRAAVAPKQLVPLVQAAVRDLNADLPLADIRTQSEQVDERLSAQRLLAQVCTGFGALALGLASMGIYGLMAYSVARRNAEIGIRMALGAQRANVAWLVLRRAVALAAVGICVGLALALGLARLVASYLYGVTPSDPATLAAACGVLAAMVLSAGYLPARRAARIEPRDALRCE